ncbi:MAG: hypothetical protein WCD86_27180 [Ktedonobacteraceae bacterium]
MRTIEELTVAVNQNIEQFRHIFETWGKGKGEEYQALWRELDMLEQELIEQSGSWNAAHLIIGAAYKRVFFEYLPQAASLEHL